MIVQFFFAAKPLAWNILFDVDCLSSASSLKESPLKFLIKEVTIERHNWALWNHMLENFGGLCNNNNNKKTRDSTTLNYFVCPAP